MKDLMDQFICIRLVKANAMDLSLFQFDYDLTFAVFFMNADNTIYGRYGTRSSRDGEKDISLEGFASALSGALQLHKNYPINLVSLAGKQPVETRYSTPDEIPSLKGKYKPTLDYQGKVVQSCMHCHQIRDAQRLVYRQAGKPLPERLLAPYPMPNVIGLSIEPKTRATISGVANDSLAESSGFQVGDRIELLNGQPILSIADFQWVLHNAKDSLTANVNRDGNQKRLAIQLTRNWRHNTDLSWRVSTWEFRRMGAGGLKLQQMPAAERRAAKLDNTVMALRVEHVGQYGEHAVAKRAGFRKGDIIVSFGGHMGSLNESQLLAYAMQSTKPNEQVPVTVLRDGRRMNFSLRMQD